MDPFTTLPSELIQQILSYIPDFVYIENLLCTSPWVKSVFLSWPHKITLDLLRSNPITTVPEIQRLLYKITILNNPSTHCCDTDSHRELLCGQTKCVEKGTAFGLPDQMTAQESFYIIKLAANIQRLACMCLHAMQQNFITAVEKSLGYCAIAEGAAEPFVWIEEYRVYWALWHLEHYRILWDIAKNRWKWSRESCKYLGDTYRAQNDMCEYSYELIWTVASVLGDLGLHPFYGHSHDQRTDSKGETLEVEEGHGEEPVHAAWYFSSTSSPCPFFSSLEPPRNFYSNRVDFPIWGPAQLPNDKSQTERFWGLTSNFRPRKLNFGPIIYEYSVVLGAGSIQAWNLEQGLEDLTQIQPFRRLGVTVWSKWRMYSVGLYSPSCQNLPSTRNMIEVHIPGGNSYVWKRDGELSVCNAISRLLELAGKQPLGPVC